MLLILWALMSSFQAKAQDLDKRISLHARNEPLGQVLDRISELGQVNFSYSPQAIPVSKKISINATNKTIRSILDEILVKNGISYVVVEKQVVLRMTHTAGNAEVGTKSGPPNYTISGFLKDKENGEVLIGATVIIKGTSTGAITNTYGFYSLKLPEGNYELQYSYLGYEKKFQSFELKSDQQFNAELEPLNINIGTIEVISKEEEEWTSDAQMGMMKMSARSIQNIPGFAGESDPIKSLQAIPGIMTYGDGSSLFYVRGGSSDQNYIIVDEAPVYNASHLFGFFTAMVPDAIKNMDVYKGDFPANFGGRLSSIIDLQTKDGNMEHFGINGSVNQFATNLAFEGPIWKRKISYYIALRKSNLSWIQLPNSYNRNLRVFFSDFNAKFNIRLNNNNRFFWTLYGGNDEYFVTNPLIYRTFGVNWTNNLGTFRWNHIFNDRVFSNLTLYGSRYNYFLQIWKEHNDYWKSSIENSAIKYNVTWYINPNNTFRSGIEFGAHRSDPGNIYLSDDVVELSVPIIPKYAAGEMVLYTSNEQRVGEKWALRYGARMPVWQNKGETTVYFFDTQHQVIDTIDYGANIPYKTFVLLEPRISISYFPKPNKSVRFSYSRTSQFIQLVSNSTSPFTSLEAWVPAGPNIRPQMADQFSTGFFNKSNNGLYVFSAELYYKQMVHQIDYADHAELLLNPLLEGELRFGKGWAYGLELMLRKTEGNTTGWIAYTYSRSMRKTAEVNNGLSYPAFNDRPHCISINITRKAGKRWVLTAAWMYMTGSAVTQPIGFYYYAGYSVPVYGSKNNGRLPDYHRLDLAATYTISKPEKRWQHNISLQLYNVYSRKNPISLSFNKMDDLGNFVIPIDFGSQSELVPTTMSVLGIIPSITYQFRF